MFTSLLTLAVTAALSHFGCASLVPVVMKALGIAKGVFGVAHTAGTVLRPPTNPNATPGQIVLKSPEEIAAYQRWAAEAVQGKSPATSAPPKGGPASQPDKFQ